MDSRPVLEGDCDAQLTGAIELVQDIFPCVTGQTYRIAGGQMCGPLTVCGEDEFEVVPPVDDADREYAPVSTCASNQMVVTPETPAADTVCGSQLDFIESKMEAYWSATVDSRPVLEGDCDAQLTGAVELVQDIFPCVTGRTFTIGSLCGVLTVCGVDEFDITPAAADADRECARISACSADQAGSYEYTRLSDQQQTD